MNRNNFDLIFNELLHIIEMEKEMQNSDNDNCEDNEDYLQQVYNATKDFIQHNTKRIDKFVCMSILKEEMEGLL